MRAYTVSRHANVAADLQVRLPRHAEPPAPEAILVFVVFLTVQALDGLLTYVGVTLLGIGVEANGLLATSMHAIGAPRALLSAKLLAAVCGYILFRTACHRPLAITTGLYVGVAVVPWLLIVGERFRHAAF